MNDQSTLFIPLVRKYYVYRRQSGTQKKLKIEEIRLSSKVKFKESTDFNTLK